MKINTKEKLNNFKGEPLTVEGEDLTVGKALAEVLLADPSGGKMKTFTLSKKLWDSKTSVDVDEADFNLIKKAVENHRPGYGTIITGQLLLILEDVK